MGVIAQIALGVLAISFFTFVALFGRNPSLRHTPIAWLYRAMWVTIPSAILAVDGRLTGGRFTAWMGRTSHFIMYGRHPTVLIFFVALLAGGEYMFLPGAWPRMAAMHRFCGSVAIALPYMFLWLSARADPGTVTAETHARWMAHYPYDFALFHPGHRCRTCGLLKPARSKHCGVCGRCVHKMDHHCVFINNCVGYGNQHFFILLLLSTAVLTAYGACVGLALVSENVRRRRPEYSLWKPSCPKSMGWSEWLVLFTLGVQEDVGVGSVTLLTLMTSPLVWGLLAYHVYLIYCGTTTNESMKWQDWQAEMDEGCAFKRAMPADRPKNPDVEAPRTRWPVLPVQVLVRTEDGRPPAAAFGPGVGEWQRVWKLRDVENLYDIGFVDNLTDVFVPNYSFRDEVPPPAMDGNGMTSDLERGRRKAKTRKPKVSAAASLVNAAT
ncbi:hypothetical protein DL764_001457 [Monosporascus ibericus]|uniref:Palmitoyltransferase n=1 Tax=Monosporascus ibericus TaxID=155417 RepID=A0A4Q4TPH0_9PEZI|nr:hypothetical protein DL764_001457 [Monosporascus ibericus]